VSVLQAVVALGLYFFMFLMSLVAHEVAHAWMAERWGDSTARLMGRLSWNPLKHIDPMWTIVIPLIALVSGLPLIGGAKPVPINPFNFSQPKRADRYVSVAGVAMNLLIALTLSLLFRVGGATGLIPTDSVLYTVLGMTIFVNLILFIFNLLPVPPLDGSHLVAGLLPEPAASRYRAVGFAGIALIMLLLWIPAFRLAFWVVLDFLWQYVLMLDVASFNEIMRGYGDMLSVIRS